MIRTSVLTALLLLACAGSKPAGDSPTGSAPAMLSAPEREAALRDLDASRHAFLASIAGLTDAQLRFKAAPDRWSVAEVAEHIAVSEDQILLLITHKIMKSPASAELRAQVQHDDERIRHDVVDRSEKRKAPEMLRPTGRFASLDAVQASFTASRDKTVAYVQNTQDDLRAHVMPHPILKALDGYQWLLLLSAHCARHTAQIEEVKADPGFPR